MLSARLDVRERLLHAGGHFAVDLAEDHLVETEDRVERRPQFVAHAREEVRLVPARRFELPPFSAISRNRRAFWIASADCVAKVFSSSTTSGANAPGAFRLTSSPPSRWSSRSSGTARSARYPARISSSLRPLW